MRRLNIGYFIKEGFLSIFSHGLMSFAAVCMIVACLIIMGSFSLLAVNVDEMLSQLEEENEFLAYIDETCTSDDVAQLMAQVRAMDNVASVSFITKQEAKAAYLEGHEGEGLYANMPDEVLRDRLSIHVVDLERFTETVEAVCALPGVANHRAENKVAEGFVTVRNAVTALATVLVAILAAVSLFIVEGLILGLMGALVAFFLQWGVYAAVGKAVTESGASALFTLIDFSLIWKGVLQVFLLSGAAIGAVGSGFAIRRFLQV